MERKVIIKTTTNPGDFSLSVNIEKIKLLRLLYFKLTGVDPLLVPELLFIKISGFSASETNQSIVSNIPRFTAECAPLYFKTDSGSTVLHGKQNNLSWVATNQKSANLLTGQIEVIDQNGQPYNFAAANSHLYLVFEAHFAQPNYLDSNWLKDKTVLNTLNG